MPGTQCIPRPGRPAALASDIRLERQPLLTYPSAQSATNTTAAFVATPHCSYATPLVLNPSLRQAALPTPPASLPLLSSRNLAIAVEPTTLDTIVSLPFPLARTSSRPSHPLGFPPEPAQPAEQAKSHTMMVYQRMPCLWNLRAGY